MDAPPPPPPSQSTVHTGDKTEYDTQTTHGENAINNNINDTLMEQQHQQQNSHTGTITGFPASTFELMHILNHVYRSDDPVLTLNSLMYGYKIGEHQLNLLFGDHIWKDNSIAGEQQQHEGKGPHPHRAIVYDDLRNNGDSLRSIYKDKSSVFAYYGTSITHLWGCVVGGQHVYLNESHQLCTYLYSNTPEPYVWVNINNNDEFEVSLIKYTLNPLPHLTVRRQLWEQHQVTNTSSFGFNRHGHTGISVSRAGKKKEKTGSSTMGCILEIGVDCSDSPIRVSLLKPIQSINCAVVITSSSEFYHNHTTTSCSEFPYRLEYVGFSTQKGLVDSYCIIHKIKRVVPPLYRNAKHNSQAVFVVEKSAHHPRSSTK